MQEASQNTKRMTYLGPGVTERTELDAFGLLETETEADRGLLACLVYKLNVVLKRKP